MPKLSITPHWSLAVSLDQASAVQPNPQAFQHLIGLLVLIHAHGSLAEASRRAKSSYRNAWGVLRNGETMFGAPLANMTRGRGATLTPLGEMLVWAEHRVAARLSPLLASLGSEINAEIERALSRDREPLRIQASHGFAVETLREFLIRQRLPFDLKYCGIRQALASLATDECEVAGLHIPIGAFQKPVLEHYAKWLKPKLHRIVHIATRRQGLMVKKNNPKRVHGLADLARPDVRFVNRQAGSGTRFLFDLVLEAGRIDAARINGYDSEEFTHAAVAAFVASGMADIGFGVETPAKRFGLRFIPMVTERYFFLVKHASLGRPAVRELRALLASTAYRDAVNDLPGLDATDSGKVSTLAETFAE